MHYPRVYTGRQLAMLAYPLGGVGAGSISLGGRGQLRAWEIFNRPDKGPSPSLGLAPAPPPPPLGWSMQFLGP